MAKYLANQIVLGKLDYVVVLEKYPNFKEEIDAFIVGKGREDLLQ